MNKGELLEILSDECILELKNLSINTEVPMTICVNENVDEDIENRNNKKYLIKPRRYLGQCIHKKKENIFIIKIAEYLLTEDIVKNYKNALKEVIIHEMIHAIADYETASYNSHSNRWKYYIDKVNEAYGYNISRLSMLSNFGLSEKDFSYKYTIFCPKCGTKWNRMKKCDLVLNPNKYVCKKCNIPLQKAFKN